MAASGQRRHALAARNGRSGVGGSLALAAKAMALASAKTAWRRRRKLAA